MPTDLQLREALRARADLVDDGIEVATITAVYAAMEGRARRRGTPARVAAIASAAAMVAAIAVVLAVANRPGSTGRGSAAATRPVGSSRLPVAPVTSPAAPVRHSNPPSLTPGVVDRISLSTSYKLIYDLRADVEYVTVELPDSRHAEVAAFAASSGFDRDRVHGATAVDVGGGHGWYGAASDWPANGRPDPQTGKQNGALPSVAWQLPSGTWVLVQSDDPSQHDAAHLAELADSLGIHDQADPTRVPFTVGEVPPGLALTGVMRDVQRDALVNMSVTLSASSGGPGLTIDLGQPAAGDPLDPSSVALASRTVGAQTLSVSSAGGSQSTVEAVLARVTAVPDSQRVSDDWPTLQDALG